jgi:hypothetical protein
MGPLFLIFFVILIEFQFYAPGAPDARGLISWIYRPVGFIFLELRLFYDHLSRRNFVGLSEEGLEVQGGYYIQR